jgi:hypothetical protein
VETKSFGERRGALFIAGTRVEVPPVEFAWRAGGRPGVLAQGSDRTPNPISTSLRLTARSVGKDNAPDLRLRHPRPVYYEPPKGQKLATDPTFLMTNPDAWNESQPFPTRERTPRFEKPKPTDPERGTVNEERQGQFSIAVAVETRVPESWYDGDKSASPGRVRVAVIGHGGVFMGPALGPVKEKLLLDVSNWLLGRDDLLARDNETWEFPRVTLGDSENALWQWGTRLGLPLLFVYLGFVVLMVRRLR